MLDPHQIILAPVITEKSMGEKVRGRYAFRVHPFSTKIDIKNAVEKLFNVKVLDVNTIKAKGKLRGKIRGTLGYLPSSKKAYVTLKPGQRIEELETA